MLQLKVFYNVSFPEGERCEVIFTDQNIQSFEELMEVVRGKIECLRFIPDSELRVQYVDDENTLINLRANDSFMDALRCAVTVPGATFHRLKVNILWQPKSTPEPLTKVLPFEFIFSMLVAALSFARLMHMTSIPQDVSNGNKRCYQ